MSITWGDARLKKLSLCSRLAAFREAERLVRVWQLFSHQPPCDPSAMESSTANHGLSKYVTLISSDGFEFVVLREAACISGAIKKMLDPKSSFKESTDGRCFFEEIKYV